MLCVLTGKPASSTFILLAAKRDLERLVLEVEVCRWDLRENKEVVQDQPTTIKTQDLQRQLDDSSRERDTLLQKRMEWDMDRKVLLNEIV